MALSSGARELPSMNAKALLDYLPAFWRSQPTEPPKKDFPAEAFDYDDRIDAAVVAKIQEEANKVLDTQEWTVIERLGDGSTKR
jgi:hypothetical protein